MAATKYVDAASAGSGDGSSWAVSGGTAAYTLAEFLAYLDSASFAVGDIYYVKAGTYTLTGAIDVSDRDGTAVAPVSIIGVKAATTAEPPTVSDWSPIGSADRPSFVCAANAVTFGDYYKIYNCTFTGTAAVLVASGSGNVFFNCMLSQTYTSSRIALRLNAACVAILCDASASNGGSKVGTAIDFGNAVVAIIMCYLHDSVSGITMADNAYNLVLSCIIDTCTTGINAGLGRGNRFFNNTIYNCTTGITASTGYNDIFINNIMDTMTDAFKWTTQTDINFFAYNHEGNSITDMWDLVEETVAAHKDNWVTSGDPDFTNEAAGDFSLEATSPCIDAGMAMALGVG